MTAPTPDWFGPDDPEMQREFLADLAIVERLIARRKIDAKFLAGFDRAVRESFTTGELTPKLQGRVDLSAYTSPNLAKLPPGKIKRRPGLEP